ncbi:MULTISPECIES: SDR family oxidoreductase [Chromohalobacter]|uniref:NAD-dependent epimerase/dehydratase n=1 Tax=Chromohalobacter israelensis (strain ATCC BAA-138 / DSM 3043 / CIP 106854 / NCIMB 13768 / 1H11) TaxID=290398 RepID=Q1QSH1_CHRI1|nr:SDR family oxidoreductase [Chromohalobacter salexigens]ABE60587.1 NAD-dependent epimerase/dehydratase [Chromohalobacter salexigens DSM 3043]
MKKSTLIIGCGDIGIQLGKRLLEAGQRVIGVRRHVAPLEGTGIEPLALDISDPAGLGQLPDADTVVYILSAERFDENAYAEAYPKGLKAVLGELETRATPPRRVFFVSSTSVYAQQAGEVVDETSETVPSGFSGVLMREAEQALLDHPLPGTVVRFSGIYGPGRDRLIRQVKEGRVAAANPPMYSNRIHRDDCAGVLTHLIALAQDGQPLETLYLASDCEPTPLHEVMTWMAGKLKVELTETIQSPLRRRASKRCDNTRLRDSGYRFQYPTFREGYEDVLKQGGFLTATESA